MTAAKEQAEFLHKISVEFADGRHEIINYRSNKDAISLDLNVVLRVISTIRGKKIAEIELIGTIDAAQQGIVGKAIFLTSPNKSHGRNGRPPALAEFICACLASPKVRQGLIGDLAEDYATNLRAGSKRRADRLYWAALLYAAGPLIWRLMQRIAWTAIGTTILRWWSS